LQFLYNWDLASFSKVGSCDVIFPDDVGSLPIFFISGFYVCPIFLVRIVIYKNLMHSDLKS